MAKKLNLNLKEKLFPMLINRAVIFFLFMCLITIFIYVIGTLRGFVDSTQLALLRFYTVLGIFLTVMSICGAAIALRRFIKRREFRYLARAGGYVFLVILGAVTVLAVMFILIISKGNIQR